VTASSLAPAPQGDFPDRLRAAAAALEALGGLVEIEPHENDTATICGRACVLRDAVVARPEMCRVVEAMLSAVAGTTVRERCDRSGSPRGRFELSAR
jgi:predicted ArsR family transcriptional regulator